jgi:hypothetical protein
MSSVTESLKNGKKYSTAYPIPNLEVAAYATTLPNMVLSSLLNSMRTWEEAPTQTLTPTGAKF